MGVSPGQGDTTWPHLCRLLLTSHWPDFGLRPMTELVNAKKMGWCTHQPGIPETQSLSCPEARDFTKEAVNQAMKGMNQARNLQGRRVMGAAK